jgi:hypothetical protein
VSRTNSMRRAHLGSMRWTWARTGPRGALCFRLLTRSYVRRGPMSPGGPLSPSSSDCSRGSGGFGSPLSFFTVELSQDAAPGAARVELEEGEITPGAGTTVPGADATAAAASLEDVMVSPPAAAPQVAIELRQCPGGRRLLPQHRSTLTCGWRPSATDVASSARPCCQTRRRNARARRGLHPPWSAIGEGWPAGMLLVLLSSSIRSPLCCSWGSPARVR